MQLFMHTMMQLLFADKLLLSCIVCGSVVFWQSTHKHSSESTILKSKLVYITMFTLSVLTISYLSIYVYIYDKTCLTWADQSQLSHSVVQGPSVCLTNSAIDEEHTDMTVKPLWRMTYNVASEQSHERAWTPCRWSKAAHTGGRVPVSYTHLTLPTKRIV